MTIVLGFGWWIIPLLVTVACFFWAFIREKPQGDYDFVSPVYWLFGTCFSLLAWLIWALL